MTNLNEDLVVTVSLGLLEESRDNLVVARLNRVDVPSPAIWGDSVVLEETSVV